MPPYLGFLAVYLMKKAVYLFCIQRGLEWTVLSLCLL